MKKRLLSALLAALMLLTLLPVTAFGANQGQLSITLTDNPISSSNPADYYSGMGFPKGGTIFPIQFYTTHPITNKSSGEFITLPTEAGPIGYDEANSAWCWELKNSNVQFGNYQIVYREDGENYTASLYISDYCGNNVLCRLDEKDETILVIELGNGGSGAMADYSSSNPPWNIYQDKIKAVTIEEGVTHIGAGAFKNCTKLTGITIPESITSIGAGAFDGCSSFTDIHYAGSESQWEKITNKASWSGVTVSCDKVDEPEKPSGGCYVATCVYGSYDCPEVWTLRRFRDETLAQTWYGRLFIKTYYAVSPTLVKWFGDTDWFKDMWRGPLDKMVSNLNAKGVPNTAYNDIDW